MQVVITRRFEKDVAKELSTNLQLELADVVEKIKEANPLPVVADLRK